MSLRKEGFLAVVAVARADGLLRADESRGLLGAAKEVGLSEGELSEVKASLENGLLHVELKRQLPESKKARTIAINGTAPKTIENSSVN